MRLLCSALVLLATFALSSSFAVPTEDLSETLYDESDSLPYEITRPLSGDLVQESVQALQVVPIVPSRLFSPLRRGLDGPGVESCERITPPTRSSSSITHCAVRKPALANVRSPAATTVVQAESEMLLEIAMSNTSNKDIGYGVIPGWPGWQMFQLDLRDAAGREVPETPVGRRISNGPAVTSSQIGVSLAPGKVLRRQLILNQFYDLGKTGEYTVQARRMDQTTGLEVKSNVLMFRVPSPALSADLIKPAITIRSPFESVKAGWQIPIQVSVKNLSPQDINLALWSGRNRDLTSKEPDEFGFEWNVRDGHGNPLLLTKQGHAFLTGEELPEGDFTFVPISPGERVEETRLVGGIYDVGSAGNYAIQVVLTDPTTNLPVKSNTVSVAVGSPVELHPPFIITIGPE
jgi:hypothetical protein